MDAPLSPSHPDFTPRFSKVAAGTLAAVADTPERVTVIPGVTRAYVHWHDPDTVTVHPFKDTPLGDAA